MQTIKACTLADLVVPRFCGFRVGTLRDLSLTALPCARHVLRRPERPAPCKRCRPAVACARPAVVCARPAVACVAQINSRRAASAARPRPRRLRASAMDAGGLGLARRPRRRPPLIAALACVTAAIVAVAGAAVPGRGENCFLLFQGRDECADGLICRVDEEQRDAAICQDPLEEGDACNNVDSKFGLSGCDNELYCAGNECVRAQNIGDSCKNDIECGLSGRCGEGSSGPECIEFAAQGERCLLQTDCAANLQCVGEGDATTYGMCISRSDEGESCSVDSSW